MSSRLNIYQISALHEMLSDKYCDPWVEVAIVNKVLEILDYRGHFEFNEDTMKIRWRTNSVQEAREEKEYQEAWKICDKFIEEGGGE